MIKAGTRRAPLIIILESFMAGPHRINLLLVLRLHVTHTFLHLLHLVLLMSVHLLILRELTLVGSPAFLNLLKIALLCLRFRLRLVRLFFWLVPGLLLRLRVKLRVWVATLGVGLGLRILHLLLVVILVKVLLLFILHLLL